MKQKHLLLTVCLIALGLIAFVINNMGLITRLTGSISDSRVSMVAQYQERMQYFYGALFVDTVPQSLEERQVLLDDEAQKYTWDATNRTVVYHHIDGSSITLTGVDIDTFVPLINGFASDAHMLYFEGVATDIPIADRPRLVGSFIVTDKQVYNVERSGPLVGADPQTFKIVYSADGKATAYYQDKHGRYNYSGRKILADYESFEVLGKYARDNKHVYLDHSIVSGANPKTFVDLGPFSAYGKDDSHVYWNGIYLTGADAESFEVEFDTVWRAQDKKSIYVNGEVVLPNHN